MKAKTDKKVKVSTLTPSGGTSVSYMDKSKVKAIQRARNALICYGK